MSAILLKFSVDWDVYHHGRFGGNSVENTSISVTLANYNLTWNGAIYKIFYYLGVAAKYRNAVSS